MLKVIGGAQEGEFKAVASGTLPNGKPVVVNADGTVSAAAEATQAIGTKTNTSGESAIVPYATFDSNSNKVVIIYYDGSNSNYLTTVIGTVSGTSISFGTPVVVSDTMGFTADGRVIAATFDSNSNKVVLAYDPQNSGGSTNAVVRVGTVSGTSISYGATTDLGGNYGYMGICFDSNNNKVVIAYIDANGRGRAVVGTVSGTTVSLGTDAQFNSNTGTRNISCAYDVANDKVVIAYGDASSFGGDGPGRAIVATVSGTSISFGSEVTFSGGNNVNYVEISYDIENSKVVIAYVDLDIVGNTTWGKAVAVVGTVSGSTISFGTRNYIHDSINVQYTFITYDPVAKKHLITSMRKDSPFQGKYVEGTVSGTDITVTSVADFNANGVTYPVSTYDSENGVCVIAYRDRADNTLGAQVYRFQTTNLTAENYIGMSRGVTEIIPSETGTAATYDSSETAYQGATFDSGNNKVVIGYRDYGNSSYGTAVVGTVSGTSITYGTPVVFETGTTNYVKAAYDSNAGKVVFVYQDQSNSAYATAVVGTVSGTSISFGTPVVFESSSTEFFGITFDSSNNKIVVAMRDNSGPPGDEQRGRAIVGTVSGTSISFGTAVTFLADSANAISIAYDTTAEKVVIAYQDSGDGNKGKAVVGTVSGTSISFGTAGIFESTSFGTASGTTYDPVNNKIVIAYRETTTGEGRAVVGTVSGTSITFGTPSSFMTGIPVDITSAYDTETGAVVITYKDNADAYTYAVAATVSGTSVSFSNTLTVENSGTTAYTASTYDTNANKSIATYKYDFGSTGVGKAIVFKVGLENRFPIADGAAASIDLIGAISTNQGGLTAGEKYYVQTDGTISTTAGSPSVLAGTAISATKLVVKT